MSEIGRYWTAKQLTRMTRIGNTVQMQAPYRRELFTLRIPQVTGPIWFGDQSLTPVSDLRTLDSGTLYSDGDDAIVCVNLPTGASTLTCQGRD